MDATTMTPTTDEGEYSEQFGVSPIIRDIEELPVYGVPPPDRTWIIERTLQELEQGQFNNAAKLWDAMWRDARIRGVISTRIQGVLGAGVECDCVDLDDAQGVAIADELYDAWPRMHADSALAKMQRYALGLGVAVAQKIYTPGDRWDYRLKIWHNQTLTWRWDTKAYHLVTANMGMIRLPRPDEASSEWIVYTPFGYEYAYLEGLIRSLASPWLARNWDQRDWARYNEVHGLAFRKAITPQNAKDSDKKAFVRQVAQLGSETTIRCPQDKDGNRFDVELLEAQALGYETFNQKLQWADKTIAIAVLGQATSTDGSKGLGSDANPGDAVRLDVKRGDNSALSQCLYEQGIREWVAFNFNGKDELAPRPPKDDKRSGYWQVEPPEDSAKAATELSTIADAVQKFKSSGAPIDFRQMLDSYGLPLISEQEEQQLKDEAEQKQQEQMIQQQSGAVPGGNTPPSGAAPTKPKPKALRALSAKRSSRHGQRSSQRYADDVAQDAKKRTGELMMHDVAYLQREIRASSSPDDLKRRLIALYRSMDSKMLARVVEKANIMARMGGRLGVIKDL